MTRTVTDSAAARARERERRRTADRMARGACVRCGENPAEPERRYCVPCRDRRRAAERARHAEAKRAGLKYGGRNVAAKKRSGRKSARRLRETRREAGLCIRCGLLPPVAGGASCEYCLAARRPAARRTYAERCAAGLCTRCGEPSLDGGTRCARCLAREDDNGRTERKNARNRQRYRERIAAGRCTDCNSPSPGAVRCEPCAKRTRESAGHFRGIPVWDPAYTVIEIDSGKTHGPFDSEAEAIAGLVFLKLDLDEVEILSDAPVTARLTGWE